MDHYAAFVASLPPSQQVLARDVEAQVRRRLATLDDLTPTAEDLRRREGGMVAGMFLDEPPEGSAPGECADCGRLIVIGPNSQVLLRLRPSMPTLCVVCAMVTMARLRGEVEVQRAKDAPRILGITVEGTDEPG